MTGGSLPQRSTDLSVSYGYRVCVPLVKAVLPRAWPVLTVVAPVLNAPAAPTVAVADHYAAPVRNVAVADHYAEVVRNEAPVVRNAVAADRDAPVVRTEALEVRSAVVADHDAPVVHTEAPVVPTVAAAV